jgi:cytochrome c-type biogenesis protein CcmH/NrfG
MKKAFSSRRRRVEVACCGAVCLLLAAGGAWAVRRGHTEPPKPAAAAAAGPAAVLDALPKTVGNSPVDGEIGKWAAKARAAVRDDRSWVNLGDALMQKVRESADFRYHGHAEAAYRQALALDDRNADAMAGLAWVHGGRHQFSESIEWARKAIALDGRNSAAYGILGDAQVERGEYDAAFVSYQKMLDIRPDIASYSRGAHLLFLTGDARKGMWLMAKAVRAGGPYAETPPGAAPSSR